MSRSFRVVRYAILALLAFVVLAPLGWLLLSSFKGQGEIFRMPPTIWPDSPTLDNYLTAVGLRDDPKYGTSALAVQLRNSIVAATASTVIVLALAVPAGYGFAKLRFRLRTTALVSMLMLRMLPAIVLLVPLFVVFQGVGLLDSLVGLVVAYTAFNLPFGIWMLSVFFRDIPSEIEDAAMVDGSGRFGLIRHIVLPVARPAIAAVGILVFLAAWNEFTLALILTSTPDAQTMPVGLAALKSAYFTRWEVMTAGAVIQAVPAVAMVVLGYRYIVSGLTMGAVK